MLNVPELNPSITGRLRYYNAAEMLLIDLRRRGVTGEGAHTRESLGPDGSGTPRLFSCAWEERYAAACVLVGAAGTYSQLISGEFRTRISRLLPDQYGIIPGQRWVCTKVMIDPFRYRGTVSSIALGQAAPDFTRAHLEAVYEQFPMDLAEDAALAYTEEHRRYVVKPGFPGADVTTETKYIGLPGGSLVYVGALVNPPRGTPVSYPYGQVENYSNFSIIWNRVPQVLWGQDTILQRRVKGTSSRPSYIGAINKQVFFGYDRHRLQLRGVEERLLPDPLFGYSWQLKFLFSEKVVPWGHLGFLYAPAPGGGLPGYYGVRRANAGDVAALAPGFLKDTESLFVERDFHNLFNPNSVAGPGEI